MAKFSAAVSAWVTKTRERQNAIHRRASELLFEAANLPIAKGGKMPVDTRFLSASFDAAIGNRPIGPTRFDGSALPDSSGNIAVVLGTATIQDEIWAGWTAAYARRQEYEHHGFARAAARRWVSEFVPQAVREARASIR